MNKDEFVVECKKIGIDINEEKLDKLEEFYNLLIYWNNKINLTTIVQKKDVYLKHFFDSLTLCRKIDFNSKLKVCDVGSGAGFPGIVLKIVFPELDIVLVDSLLKRVNYLNCVIEELKLKKIVAIHSRMEDFSRKNEEVFDIIVARAVANLSFLSEISVRSLKIGGKLVFMKGKDSEIEQVDGISKCLFLDFVEVDSFILPYENSNRSLVIFNKIHHSPDKYPRSVDKMRKNSL